MSENIYIAILRIHGERVSANVSVAIRPFRVDEGCLHYSVAENANDFPALVDATQNFLSQNKDAIRRLMAANGVAGGILDIGTSFNTDKAAQFFRFPNAALSLVSELGLTLEISIYH